MHEMEVRFLFLFDFLHLPPGLIMPFVVTGIIATVAWLMTRKQELIPTPLQNLGEVAVEELETFVEGILGHKHAAEFAPFLGTLFVFIMTSNLIGLIPGLRSPTATFTDCASLALMIFCTTQYLGFSRHGLGYLKHFVGEPLWMAPLNFPIHVIGEISRPISLTLRLFGNIMGEDVVIMVLMLYLVPWILPLPMLALAVFTSVVQALVFTLLSSVYFAGALGESH